MMLPFLKSMKATLAEKTQHHNSLISKPASEGSIEIDGEHNYKKVQRSNMFFDVKDDMSEEFYSAEEADSEETHHLKEGDSNTEQQNVASSLTIVTNDSDISFPINSLAKEVAATYDLSVSDSKEEGNTNHASGYDSMNDGKSLIQERKRRAFETGGVRRSPRLLLLQENEAKKQKTEIVSKAKGIKGQKNGLVEEMRRAGAVLAQETAEIVAFKNKSFKSSSSRSTDSQSWDSDYAECEIIKVNRPLIGNMRNIKKTNLMQSYKRRRASIQGNENRYRKEFRANYEGEVSSPLLHQLIPLPESTFETDYGDTSKNISTTQVSDKHLNDSIGTEWKASSGSDTVERSAEVADSLFVNTEDGASLKDVDSSAITALDDRSKWMEVCVLLLLECKDGKPSKLHLIESVGDSKVTVDERLPGYEEISGTGIPVQNPCNLVEADHATTKMDAEAQAVLKKVDTLDLGVAPEKAEDTLDASTMHLRIDAVQMGAPTLIKVNQISPLEDIKGGKPFSDASQSTELPYRMSAPSNPVSSTVRYRRNTATAISISTDWSSSLLSPRKPLHAKSFASLERSRTNTSMSSEPSQYSDIFNEMRYLPERDKMIETIALGEQKENSEHFTSSLMAVHLGTIKAELLDTVSAVRKTMGNTLENWIDGATSSAPIPTTGTYENWKAAKFEYKISLDGITSLEHASEESTYVFNLSITNTYAVYGAINNMNASAGRYFVYISPYVKQSELA